MKLEEMQKLCENMDDAELYELIKEVRRNRNESISEARIKKTRESAKKGNIKNLLESLTPEEKEALLETYRNENPGNAEG